MRVREEHRLNMEEVRETDRKRQAHELKEREENAQAQEKFLELQQKWNWEWGERRDKKDHDYQEWLTKGGWESVPCAICCMT